MRYCLWHVQQGLPVQFCKKHLPDEDKMITLVDEKGEEFPTKYLAEKTGLSGGWRGFSVDHNLVDGDALVFQLVTPTEFKVTNKLKLEFYASFILALVGAPYMLLLSCKLSLTNEINGLELLVYGCLLFYKLCQPLFFLRCILSGHTSQKTMKMVNLEKMTRSQNQMSSQTSKFWTEVQNESEQVTTFCSS